MAKKSASSGAEPPPEMPRGLRNGNPMTSQASRTIKPAEILARLSGLGKGLMTRQGPYYLFRDFYLKDQEIHLSIIL